jgi:hypothetical protein
MAKKTFGAKTATLQLQPNWTLVTNFDQTITGSGVFKVDKAKAITGAPKIGDPHPHDPRARIINFSLLGSSLQYEYSVQYFGLVANPTKPIYSYYTSLSEEPIETHKDFSTFGGTADTPATGAVFDETTKLFDGFNDLAAADLVGVRGYLTGQPSIRRTFYTTSVYTGLEDITTTREVREGVIPGVSISQNVLKTNWSSDIIGNNFYRVTEEYLLSGKDGWSATIYEDSGNVE